MLQPYLKSTQIFDCPSDSVTPAYNGVNSNEAFDYGMSVFFDGDRFYAGLPPITLSSLPKTSETILVADAGSFRVAPEGYSTYGVTRPPLYRHLDAIITLFADGHVKAMKESQIQEKATSEDGIALTGDNQFVLWNLY